MSIEPKSPDTFADGSHVVHCASAIPTATQTLQEAWHLGCIGQSGEALNQVLDLWNKAATSEDATLQARCSVDIAWYCFQLGLAEQGYSHARLAVEFWTAGEHPVEEARARAMSAWLLLEMGCVDEATDEAMRALVLAESSGDAKVHSLALNVVGSIFWLSRQTAQAVDFCGRAVTMARGLDDPFMLSWWLINLGCALGGAAYAAQDGGDHDTFSTGLRSALEAVGEALDLALSAGDPWAEKICRNNMAEYLVALGDFSAAQEHLNLYSRNAGGDYDRNRRHYLYTLGQFLSAQGRLEDAINPLNECLTMAEQGGNIEAQQYALLYLSEAHEKAGRFDLALSFHKRFHKAHLQFSAEKTQQRARLAEIFYETTKLKAQVDIESRRARDMAQSYQELKRISERMAKEASLDPLTGLHNRRCLDATLSELVDETKPYALVMIDIDHFKKINDRYSHMVGDQVLCQVATLIRSVKREEDLAVRFGGEEFTLLIRESGLPDAGKICLDLHRLITDWDWNSTAKLLKVTVSMGVADHTEAIDPRTILELADRRLYYAKNTGRNRVVVSGSRHHAGQVSHQH